MYVQEAVELRSHVARVLQGRAAAIVNEAIGVYPFAGIEHVAAEDRGRLGELAFQLLTTAVRDGELDSGYAVVGNLGRLAADKEVSTRLLFTVLYLIERATLDALALDESFGPDTEPWPALTQLIHRASLDVCAAVSEHVARDGAGHGTIDSLTTLHTRPVFLAALEKEIQRCERFGHSFALIVVDVDRLADINGRHGYGAGDRVIERVGIVVRNYFRETDWVARLGGDTFGVLLPEIQGFNAERLAERMRITVQERLQLHDHRSDEQYQVTVSVGVLVAEIVDRSVKAEQLLTDALDAVRRAKQAGRNRVERVNASVGGPPAASRDPIKID